MMNFFQIICLLLFASLNVVFSQEYTMADLEVLQERQNYKEFFLHAKDIRPSARDKAWKGLVQQMSEDYMREMTNRPFVSTKDFNEVNNLTNWSTIRENIGFLVLRNKFGLKYFKNCFQQEINKQSCYKKSLEFIKKTPNQVQMATDLGQIIYKSKQKLETKDIIGMNLWPFFELMTKSPISEFYCDKDFFRNEVVNQIYLNIEDLNSKEVKKKINKIAHKDCWKKLKEHFKSNLHSPSGLQNINAFIVLKSMDEIKDYDETLFLISYLLNFPSPGELFKKSWDKLSKINKDYITREKLINDFKEMDILPGNIFKYLDDKRSLVIIKSFMANFPEYIDLYSQTCLKYFEGTVNFPNGKPALECDNWFKTARKYELVPEMMIKRFDAARNFQKIKI